MLIDKEELFLVVDKVDQCIGNLPPLPYELGHKRIQLMNCESTTIERTFTDTDPSIALRVIFKVAKNEAALFPGGQLAIDLIINKSGAIPVVTTWETNNPAYRVILEYSREQENWPTKWIFVNRINQE